MKFLFNLLLAPFRVHEFDLDNIVMLNQGSLDKDVTQEPRVMLYFVALCKHCGRPHQVSRETYIDPESIGLWDKWFCVRDPVVFKHWKEQLKERAGELQEMTAEDYINLTHNSDTDKRL